MIINEFCELSIVVLAECLVAGKIRNIALCGITHQARTIKVSREEGLHCSIHDISPTYEYHLLLICNCLCCYCAHDHALSVCSRKRLHGKCLPAHALLVCWYISILAITVVIITLCISGPAAHSQSASRYECTIEQDHWYYRCILILSSHDFQIKSSLAFFPIFQELQRHVLMLRTLLNGPRVSAFQKRISLRSMTCSRYWLDVIVATLGVNGHYIIIISIILIFRYFSTRINAPYSTGTLQSIGVMYRSVQL